MDDQKPEPYGLEPSFERAIVVLSCSRSKFYGRIGHELEPDALELPAAKVAMQAAHTIKAEMGHGPDTSVVLMQRLHSWMRSGKLALEQVHAVSDMFDDAEDAGLPGEEAAVNELRPVLAARLRRQAVREAMMAHGQQKDLSSVVALEDRAKRIGVVDTSIGVVVGASSFEDIRALRKMSRLRTGIPELDQALVGGHQRGGLACWCGGTGDGKSMALSHQAGVSCVDGHVVAALTLELPRAIWQARSIANITGIPIDALLTDDLAEKRALELMNERADGMLVVHQMPGQGTSCRDVFAWVDGVEQFLGRRVSVLIVDYADKLYVPPRTGGKEVGSYDAGKYVMEGLRGFAEERNLWMWTGSQSQGRERRRKKLDTSDTAESINKPRIADLWITLNVSEDQEEIEFFIAKHRTAKARITVGPLPTEFEVGRVAPIMEG
jgi:hypothetical protein